MLIIIDYGIGNLSSIKNMLKKIGVDSIISNKEEDIINADKLIVPGVGHFDYGMQHLNESGLVDALNEGLGWIKGKTVAFDKTKLDANHKIPHMGWTDIKGFGQSQLFTGMYDEPRFYFVHSYHLQLDNHADVLATANYGYDFAIGIEHENILGVQFHPEKSHKFGMKLLENFVKYY